MISFGSAPTVASSLGLGTLHCGDARSKASSLGTNTGFPVLLSRLKAGGVVCRAGGAEVLILVQVCLELQQNWMESGVSEDAVSGHIQVSCYV